MVEIRPITDEDQALVQSFLTACLPESNRAFEPDGRHCKLKDIQRYFKQFWCLSIDGCLAGTVGISELSKTACELKTLFVLKQYHGNGYGEQLARHAIAFAQSAGYTDIYLDTMSESKAVIFLYKKLGFTKTERYNDNPVADVFMKRRL